MNEVSSRFLYLGPAVQLIEYRIMKHSGDMAKRERGILSFVVAPGLPFRLFHQVTDLVFEDR